MNSFLAYYVVWVLLSYALREPWLLLGLVVLLVFRRFVPSPNAVLGLMGRARAIRAQVEVNRANVTARRDLAVIYLDGMRARAAVPLLQEGLALSPNDAELLYLLGLALHRVGRHEEALVPLVRAVEADPRVRYGLPYAVAGDALFALKRWEEALDAHERYLDSNSSDISGYTRVARSLARMGDRAAARETLREGLRTWGTLPSSMKRRQLGHYLAAQWGRVAILGEPLAIAQLLAVVVVFAIAVRFAYAPVLRVFASSTPSHPSNGYDRERRALYAGFARCGSQSTGSFVGRYTVLANSVETPPLVGSASPTQVQARKARARMMRELYANFEIKSDRIVSGESLVQEVCLTRVMESTPDSLAAEAVVHEDNGDPGDASLVIVRLARRGDFTTMRLELPGAPNDMPQFVLKLERR